MFDFLLWFAIVLFIYKLFLLSGKKVDELEKAEKVDGDFGKRKYPFDDFDLCDEPLKKKSCGQDLLLFRVIIYDEFDTEEDDTEDDAFADDLIFDDLNDDAIEFINRDPRLNRSIDEFLREHADRYVLPRLNELPMDVVSISSEDSIESITSDSVVSVSSDSILSVPSDSVMSISTESVVTLSSDDADNRNAGNVRGK